jgi:hypothetical protein
MVANSIEVSINHATGAIDVNTSSVSIEAQFNQSLGGTQPHLLDIHDSGSGASNNLTDALLAPKDIDAILDGADDPAEEAPPPPLVIPTVVTTARQQIDLTLGQTAKDGTIEETTIRTAVESVLESAATDDVVPVEESDETEAKDVSEEESEEVSKPELDLPEIVTPLLLNRPEYSARIFITAYEHQVNDRSERITFMRFDAVIPLSTPPVAEPDVPAPVIPTTDAPVADTTEEEPESKVA